MLRSIDFLAPRIAALSGAGVISPEDALDFHMTAKLQSFGGMQLVTGRSVPFFINGTASSPSFAPESGRKSPSIRASHKTGQSHRCWPPVSGDTERHTEEYPEAGGAGGVMREYAVIIERGENSYGAYVPDLPGCVAIAESETEVRKLIREAIELHVKATLDERGRNQGQPACFRTGAAGLTENSSTTTRPTASARPAKAHARQTIREGKQGENRDSLNCVLRSIDFLAPRIAALSGAGIISPEDALDFHMTAKLQSFGGMQLVTGRSVPFFIKGTAASPSFEPDMKGMATGDFKALGGLFGKRKR